jgi:hypothetical protein
MIKTSVTAPSFEVISKHIFAEVLLNKETNQKALFAAASFSPGDIICKFSAATSQSFASYLTIQTGVDKHITLLPEFLQYTNHSCEPTVFFNTTSMELVCLQAMQPGDEFTFFYPSTEWEMAQPFVCNCGSAACLQLINGASHLSVETLSKYKLTDFIRQQVRQKLSL